MSRRLRKFIGMAVMLGYIPLYALIAMALAQGRITSTPTWVQTIAYITLGLIWVVPLLPLIKWMERKGAAEVE
jgi:predicted membrane channel-forming protein YqfA (hemolysin III family)